MSSPSLRKLNPRRDNYFLLLSSRSMIIKFMSRGYLGSLTRWSLEYQRAELSVLERWPS